MSKNDILVSMYDIEIYSTFVIIKVTKIAREL